MTLLTYLLNDDWLTVRSDQVPDMTYIVFGGTLSLNQSAIKLLLVTVNNRLKFEIEIVHDLSCHPIVTQLTCQISHLCSCHQSLYLCCKRVLARLINLL